MLPMDNYKTYVYYFHHLQMLFAKMQYRNGNSMFQQFEQWLVFSRNSSGLRQSVCRNIVGITNQELALSIKN
jgi:hypothetical protein